MVNRASETEEQRNARLRKRRDKDAMLWSVVYKSNGELIVVSMQQSSAV